MVQSPAPSSLDLGTEEDREIIVSITTDQQSIFHLDLCSLMPTLNVR